MDLDALEVRVNKCEEDIRTLFHKTNRIDKTQSEVTTKIDNVLVELGRLRESIETLKTRPGKMWDKLIYGIIGAAAAALVSIIINGGV